MNTYDIVIIGLGPAGLMAANRLKKQKISFLAIDRKEKIGLPLRCGEGIREKEFIKFFRHSDYPFVKNIVHRHKVISKNIEKTFSSTFLQLDRPKFEQWLAKPITKNIMLNTKCEDIIIKRDCTEIITDKGSINSKLVILCDGCNSKIQKKFRLINKKQAIIPCYGGIYKNCNLDSDKFYFFFDDRLYGGFWVFPKTKTTANIGIGAVGTADIKTALKDFLKEYGIKAKQISEYSGVFPCSGPIDKTYHNRILLCGNAAGFVYAGTGEGIYFALESGAIAASIAAKALNKNRFDKKYLSGYEKLWKRSFGEHMKGGIIFRDLLYLAARFKKIKSAFKQPTEKELRKMVLEGKIPFRAKLVWNLAKLYRLHKRKTLPFSVRLAAKLLNFKK